MPVPWGDPGKPTRIPNVVDRAMTVKQLMDFRALVKRLTKTGLLKNTTPFSKASGTFGQAIDWSDINLYQITDEVIKKVIPHVDPEGEYEASSSGGRRWYSWTELVARKPQRATVMMSHWWGGRFNDFTTAIDRLVLDKSLSVSTAIWICTFANCQFGEDFGTMLSESPFVKVLSCTDLTVHVVDRIGGSLTRSWCGLELQYTIMNEAELALYTSAGAVGSSYVSGGPLVEEIKGWDIRQSEASDAPYRRQILNYIAGVDEVRGLKTTTSGAMELNDAKRPQLKGGDEEARDPLAKKRINGEDEYSYEASLFQKHGDKFENLNMMVRLSVMKGLEVGRRPKGCTLASMAERGVTISQLRTFTLSLKASCPWSKDRAPWWFDGDFPQEAYQYEELRPRHVMHYVGHLTSSRSCTWVELRADRPQIPQHFLEFAWKETWVDIMASLEWYIEANRLPDSEVLYVDILAANYRSTSREQRQDEVQHVLQECSGFLRILSDDEESMSRAWPLFNMEQAARSRKKVFLGCKTAVMACSAPFPDGSWVFGRFDPDIARRFTRVDIREAQCSPASLKFIHDFIERSYLATGVDDGFCRFNSRKALWCAGPMLRDAAANDDADTIASLKGIDGLRLESSNLTGGLGESALHVAAGRASLNALRALLDAKVDPNIEDGMRERPLHCAALGGHAEVVRMLLSARADIRCESEFAEVPIEVAHQNPAGFLGVDTTEVVAVLTEAWERERGCTVGSKKCSAAEKLREEVYKERGA